MSASTSDVQHRKGNNLNVVRCSSSRLQVRTLPIPDSLGHVERALCIPAVRKSAFNAPTKGPIECTRMLSSGNDF
jgi:hypothetical protein